MRAERYALANASPAAGRIDRVVHRSGGNLLGASVHDHDRAADPEREHDLRDAEVGERVPVAAGEHVGLLLRDLENRDVPQHVRVEVGVERERPRRRHAHEPLRVEQQPAPRAETLERRRVEVAAQKRRDVQRLDAAQQAGRRLVEAPRLADDIDVHRPRAVRVIGEGERRRLAARRERRRQADRREAPLPLRAVGVAALREEHGVVAEQAQGAPGVPGAAAYARRGARDDVTREMSDYAERPHGREA